MGKFGYMKNMKTKFLKKENTNKYLLAISALIILFAFINLNRIDNQANFAKYREIYPKSSFEDYIATIRFLTNVAILPAIAMIFYTVFTLNYTEVGKVYKSTFVILIILSIFAMIRLLRPITPLFFLIIILQLLLMYVVLRRDSIKKRSKK